MQPAVKCVKTYILENGEWRERSIWGAKSILTTHGLHLERVGVSQRVEIVFENPTALDSFSIEGPVKKVVCVTSDGIEERQVTILQQKTYSLQSHDTKWDAVFVEIPSLLSEVVAYRVSLKARDFVHLSDLRTCLEERAKEGRGNVLVLECKDSKEVNVDLLLAMASSVLVLTKFTNPALCRGEDLRLNLSDYSEETVRCVARIMTDRVIRLEHVNRLSVDLMNYLQLDGWEAVWDVMCSGMNADNCIEFMEIAQEHSNAATMLAGARFAQEIAGKKDQAISIMFQGLSLFEVKDVGAFIGSLVPKEGGGC